MSRVDGYLLPGPKLPVSGNSYLAEVLASLMVCKVVAEVVRVALLLLHIKVDRAKS